MFVYVLKMIGWRFFIFSLIVMGLGCMSETGEVKKDSPSIIIAIGFIMFMLSVISSVSKFMGWI